MENVSQDAMMHNQRPDFNPDTDGPAQTPDESIMLNEDYNPTDLAGNVDSGPDGTGEPSGSAAMTPDPDPHPIGNDGAIGNNDGTEPDPGLTDSETITPN